MEEHYRPTWDLTTIPDDQLYSEVGRRRGAHRKLPSGPKARCACGECPLCRHRERMRRARAVSRPNG